MKALPLVAGLLAAAASAIASAHTPYLAPNEFSPRPGATLALDASFAETFFVPDAAFDGSAFFVIGPDGKQRAIEDVRTLKRHTVAEFQLPNSAGTYRFSTGPRLGARFRTWEINGKRESSRDAGATIPAGAKIISDFQSLTQADTYVTAGSPNRTALAALGKGLELVAIDHPNDLYVGERFRFVVQHDGKPLANQPVEITEAVWQSDRKPQVIQLVTDAQGQATFDLKQAGAWIALTRYRTPAPAGAAAPEYSHSSTLTFRVLGQ